MTRIKIDLGLQFAALDTNKIKSKIMSTRPRPKQGQQCKDSCSLVNFLLQNTSYSTELILVTDFDRHCNWQYHKCHLTNNKVLLILSTGIIVLSITIIFHYIDINNVFMSYINIKNHGLRYYFKPRLPPYFWKSVTDIIFFIRCTFVSSVNNLSQNITKFTPCTLLYI